MAQTWDSSLNIRSKIERSSKTLARMFSRSSQCQEECVKVEIVMADVSKMC